MFIRFTGENVEEIRAAINALKPDSTIVAATAKDFDGVCFDQVWPSRHVSHDRWRIRVGQYLNAKTGAVVDELPEPCSPRANPSRPLA